MRTLVTGAAGFIGSHLSRKLVQDGHEVVGIDNFDPYYSEKLKKLNLRELKKFKKFQFANIDITNLKDLEKIMKGIDLVYHLAARPGVMPSFFVPEVYHRNNVVGTFNVLFVARNTGVKKVLFCSSSSVYGQAVYLPMDENHPLNANSPYGVTKIIAEKYCLIFDTIYKLPVNIVRLFSVYGPSQRPDLSIAEWTEDIFKRKKVIARRGLEQTRSYTYIDDTVDGIVAAMNADFHGEIINIGSPVRIPVKLVVNKLIELSGIGNVKIEVHKRPDEDRLDTHANIRKAKRLLHWKPKTKIDEGLKNYVEWRKKNRKLF